MVDMENTCGLTFPQKIAKQEFTAEFKELVVKRVKAGQLVGAVAGELGLDERTLRNWVKADTAGKLKPILIWDGCVPVVSDAIGRFSVLWGPYSGQSKRYVIFRLIEEVIDPAVRSYADHLPPEHPGLVVGVPGLHTDLGIGELARVCGFSVIERSMREALRHFLPLSDGQSVSDLAFIATVETLIELVVRCASIRPQKSKARDHESLNAQRRERPLCALCGKPTELAAYLQDAAWPSLDSADASLALRLSSRYCTEHRPMADGVWNASYKRAVRSKARFEVELARLSKQSCKLSFPLAKTGERLVDQYVWNYIGHLALYPDERSDLRESARRMVETKITDRKKQIIMLHALGHNQSEVARQLGISRQAVSKALKSIPTEYQRFGAS